MKPNRTFGISLCVVAIMVLLNFAIAASDVRTQTMEIGQGWNAVYLAAEPDNNSADELFDGTPISMAATYFHRYSVWDVPTDPGQTPFEKEGWGVWYSPDQPASFAKNLHYLTAGRTYLVYADEAFQWTVTGRVKFRPVRWQSDSFNFVGLSVNPEAPPTFEQFFSGSPAHSGLRIYTLVAGEWKKIAKPSETTIKPYTGYWIYCKGGSDYTGPLEVKIPYGDTLDFGNVSSRMNIRVTNRTDDPLRVGITNLNGDTGLPISYEERNLTQGKSILHRLTGEVEADTLEPGGFMKIHFSVHRELFSDPSSATVLRINDDKGIFYDVPVTAEK